MNEKPDFPGFRRRIYRFYRRHGRDLPWRRTNDPYLVLVSEFMLQQTQVGRVVEKYGPFIDRFPGFSSLAGATTREVLDAWQGLGYNRRALALHDLARIVAENFSGRLPDDEKTLRQLPGIGPYTASAVLAFAFSRPVVMIETNIRRVYLHCFFKGRAAVGDQEILPLVQASMDRKNPRRWYNALMDYGSFLGSFPDNPNRRSNRYRRQAPFEGSARQVRGRVVKLLIGATEMTRSDLCRELDMAPGVCEPVLLQLEREGFIEDRDGSVRIKGRESQPLE